MTRARRTRAAATLAAAALLGACSGAPAATTGPTLFEALAPERTGVAFENRLPEAADFNILHYLYYYNGGGVAAGDVNGDGLPDLYFTSNLESNRLYLNRGGYRFEDVTERAGVGGIPGGWTTGVTMADVNGDGHLDLYVAGVSYLTKRGRNVLYVNRGDGTFADSTDAFGLGHVGYSTQAAFLDYDGDGDLDMYLLNHSTHTERQVGRRAPREERHPTAGDRLFRNDGDRFTDVSEAAGIHGGVEGYGLGIVATDVNLDVCPDLYVANDFQEDDFLYVNRCDGTFAESIRTATAHTSRFSMGVDAADLNEDGLPDVVVVDMLPDREDVLKTSAGWETVNLFEMRLRAGYHPQYPRNTLQLNRGGVRFSDVAYLAGVHATDWSWAPLLADLDDDGRKDLFITNGIYRRPNDLDYINYVGNDAVQAALARGIGRDELALLQRMPQIPLANHAFRNDGDLSFASVAEAWGLAQPGFSNGAVYVDLDNTGSLDLVVSNINAPASIYRNRGRSHTGHGSLTLELEGEGANTQGLGARAIVVAGGRRQTVEVSPTRGFQSSVDVRPHFGLGAATVADSVIVIWPDRRFEVRTGVAANQRLVVRQADAAGRWVEPAPAAAPLLADASARLAAAPAHAENRFLDFNREPLIPHLVSAEGPALAAGDVDGDGLDDLYLGGAKWQGATLLVQQADGSFRPRAQPAFAADSLHEDVDALFLDANGDGHLDLYVVSGGNEFWGEAEALRDRLYLNDGRGGFTRDRAALPDRFENGGAVAAGDMDGDGDLDLFVGGRVVAREYGRTPRSALLRNDGGRFTDVTAQVAPSLATIGMVTDAAWVDEDGDGRPALVVVGEWMPVRVFRAEGGRLVDRTREAGLAGSEGWWSSVAAADLTGDGRPELVLGNLGRNSFLRASAAEPARLHVHDFGGTGAVKSVLTSYRHGVSYPLVGRDDLVRLIPSLRSRYPSYAAFGAARLEDVFPADELAAATVLEARTFESAVATRGADGRYALRPLPMAAQVAPIRAIVTEDVDGDGHVDVLAAGNFRGVTPVRGWYDAGRGVLLRGRGDGTLTAMGDAESGLALDGEVRHLAPLRLAGGARGVAVARNDDTPQLLRLRDAPRPRAVAAAPRP